MHFKEHLRNLETAIDAVIEQAMKIPAADDAQAEDISFVVDTLSDAKTSVQGILRTASLLEAIHQSRAAVGPCTRGDV